MLSRFWYGPTMERLRRGLKPCMRVLLYHRVDRPGADPFAQAVWPDRFEQQMRYLSQHLVPLTLDELVAAVATRRVIRNGVAVTFDDGYADNLQTALPILERYAIPATIFIATGLIGRSRPNWWDELQQLVLGPGGLPTRLMLEVDGAPQTFGLDPEQARPGPRPELQSWRAVDPAAPGTRHHLFLQLYHALQPLEPGALEHGLEQLRQQLVQTPEAGAAARMLTEAELQPLARSPLITLGAHTHDHVRLPGLDPGQQRYQLARSRAWLEKRIDRPVRHLAYPYGEASPLTQALAADVGFQSACRADSRPVRRGVPPHAIPRFLPGNWDEARFAAQLDWWY